jgi:hypothetical protein
MFAEMHSMGFNIMDLAPMLSSERFCDPRHLGGPGGSIAARALFWKLKALDESRIRQATE